VDSLPASIKGRLNELDKVPLACLLVGLKTSLKLILLHAKCMYSYILTWYLCSFRLL